MQSRKHAEEAMSHLNGSMVHGSEMKLVFSKPVPIPPQPIYPPPAHLRQIRANMSAAAGKVVPKGEHSWGRGQTDEEVIHKACSWYFGACPGLQLHRWATEFGSP